MNPWMLFLKNYEMCLFSATRLFFIILLQTKTVLNAPHSSQQHLAALASCCNVQRVTAPLLGVLDRQQASCLFRSGLSASTECMKVLMCAQSIVREAWS